MDDNVVSHRSINGEIAAYFPGVSHSLLLVTSLLGNDSYLHIVRAAGSPAAGWTHKCVQTHILICINVPSHASPSSLIPRLAHHCDAKSTSENESESIHQKLIRIYAE